MNGKMYVTTVIWTLLFFLALLQGLVACNNTTIETSSNDEPAVFTDADIDTAELSLAAETLDIANLDSEDLSTQARIRGAYGYVYFIANDPDVAKPWRVRRFNQSIVDKPIVYKGKRQIQSVAGSEDGNTLIVSMRETIQASSDYEIYKLVIDPPSVKKLTNNNVPDINVSMSRNGKRKVWEGSVGGKAIVYLRISNQEAVINHNSPQREPSISGNGKYIALIREGTSGDRIKVYKIASGTYENVPTDDPTQLKSSPSVSDVGNKVLWLEPGATNKIKLINLTTNTITEEVSSTNSLNHPHLTPDGYWFGYSEELVGNGGWRVFTKNTLRGITKQGTTLPSDVDHTGAYWQKSNPFPNEFKLTTSDGAAGDIFGRGTVISDTFAVIGAPFKDENAPGSGAAYVFEKQGNQWGETAKLLPSDGTPAGGRFGFSIDIEDTTIVIGATWDDDNGGRSGSVYIFEKQGDQWIEQTKLTASDGKSGDNFGNSVSISGKTIIVGAYDVYGGGNSPGAAYIFEKQNGLWVEKTKLTPSIGSNGDGFGIEVSIDGPNAVVGVFNPFHNNRSNAAYVFERQNGNWVEKARFTSGNEEPTDVFGNFVAISGTTIIVGASNDDESNTDSGAAYIFEKQGGEWVEQAKLKPADNSVADQWGSCVDISGTRAILASNQDDDNGSNSGSIVVFEKQDNAWVETTKLVASDGTTNDRLGAFCATNGTKILAGAFGAGEDGHESGAAYIFE